VEKEGQVKKNEKKKDKLPVNISDRVQGHKKNPLPPGGITRSRARKKEARSGHAVGQKEAAGGPPLPFTAKRKKKGGGGGGPRSHRFPALRRGGGKEGRAFTKKKGSVTW